MKKLFQASWQKDRATKKGIIATLHQNFWQQRFMPEDNSVPYLTYAKNVVTDFTQS